MSGTALITGGTGGLGVAVVERFLADGARVVVPYIDERELERMPEHEGLDLVEADLFDAASVRAVVDHACADGAEPLSAVVNLVGGYDAPRPCARDAGRRVRATAESQPARDVPRSARQR